MDLPVPKFIIGQTVYRPRVTSTEAQLSCPDCLGTRKWSVTTPGGATFEARCQRCSRDSTLPRGVPGLNFSTHVGVVDRLTIGSVRIDTASTRSPVEYMATETGIGSGSIYYERDLFEGEDAARSRADSDAAQQNVTAAEKPERVEQAIYSTLTLENATIKAAEDAVWNSWWAYRHLFDDLERYVEAEPGETLADMRANLQWTLEYERGHREPPLLQPVLDAARAYVKDSDDARFPAIDLANALAKIDAAIGARRERSAADRLTPPPQEDTPRG